MAKGFESRRWRRGRRHGGGTGGGLRPGAADDAGGLRRRARHADRGARGGRTAAAAGCRSCSGPADAAKALGVSEADVMAVLESGELKGKKIGATWRISRAALDGLHGRVAATRRHALVAARSREHVGPRSPRSRSTPVRPAARRPSGTRGKQKLVCPFCGTESPYRHRSRDRQGRRAGSRDGAARAAGRASAAGRPRRAACSASSCRAVMVFERRAGRARTASSAARRRWWTTRRSRRRSGRRACCRSGSIAAQVRDDIRRWWRSKWFAPGRLARTRAGRHAAQPLHPVLDVRRPRALSVGGRGRLSLLRERRRPRQQGQPRRAAGAAHALGAGVRRDRSRLRRRAGAGHAGAADGPAAAGGAVPDPGSGAVRHGVPVRPRRRALQGGADRGRRAVAAADARRARARCARRRSPATRTGTSASPRRSPAARSSTCWCRCGCSPTTTGPRRSR